MTMQTISLCMCKTSIQMATNKKIERVHLESFLYFIIESIVHSLNVGIIALERLQSSVKEVSMPNTQRLCG